MIHLTHLVIIIGVLCVLFLLTLPKRQPVPKERAAIKEMPRTVTQEIVLQPIIVKPIRLETERDPLLYVDDGMYYKNPLTIEGNRVWVEQHPRTDDLEWGMPLYTDRWSNGLYNGSYKTYRT